MTPEEFDARKIELLEQERADPEQAGIWWLSFVGDDGFLGAIVTRAAGFCHALEKSDALGVNPGGQVQGVQLDELTAVCVASLAKYQDRLLNRDECEQCELDLIHERERLAN